MSNSFMSPLPTFTLESLVTNGQWTAAQNGSRKKNLAKPGTQKKSQQAEAPRSKEMKPTL
jgi:hypothetical protein